MNDPSDASPFAAFAMPKRSAIEEFQDRQRRAAESRRKMIGSALACLVGSTVGAGAWAAFDSPLDAVLTSFIGALIGSTSGSILGGVVGGIVFGMLLMYGSRGSKSIGSELARRDPLAALRAMIFSWTLIGMLIGAALGARIGATWAGAEPGLAKWTMVGALLGGGFGLAVWYFTLSSIAQRERDPDITA
jgi:hypothetical protein